jgi:hypothetical protein
MASSSHAVRLESEFTQHQHAGAAHIVAWLFIWPSATLCPWQKLASVIRIIGAGYWRKGKAIYERENQIHR